MMEAEKLVRRNSIQKLFDGYYFDNQKIEESKEEVSSKRGKLSFIEAAREKALEQKANSRNHSIV